jgi:Peptidase family M23
MVLSIFSAPLWISALLVLAAGAHAQVSAPPALEVPVACRLNEACWLVNHVDLDPGQGRKDYRCGTMTYDGHKGTDIGIVHGGLSELAGDTGVVAAAPGLVLGVRDGMRDEASSNPASAALTGRECGNGVVLSHGGGWTTQYCHLRQGSVTVRNGDRVATGQRLGTIGMSGFAAFPHLHFQVAQDGRVVDPFTGPAALPTPRCAASPDALWTAGARESLQYPAGSVVSAAWLASAPPNDPVAAPPKPLRVWPTQGPVHFYAVFLGVSAGDTLNLEVTGEDGRTIAQSRRVAERSQIRVSQWIRIASLEGLGTTLTGHATIASAQATRRSKPVVLQRAVAR